MSHSSSVYFHSKNSLEAILGFAQPRVCAKDGVLLLAMFAKRARVEIVGVCTLFRAKAPLDQMTDEMHCVGSEKTCVAAGCNTVEYTVCVSIN